MEYIIKTHHGYRDATVNEEMKEMAGEGWRVKQIEYSSQVINEHVKSCIIVLYEREAK